MDAMVGMIFMLPFDWAPRDYLKCQGQILNVMQYQALYSLIANTYGGSGTSTFALPNLQGRTAIGTGQAQSGTNYPIAQTVGSETTTLTTPNLPPHTHAATFQPTTGPQSVTIPAATGNQTVAVTVNATTNASATGIPSAANSMLSNAAPAKIYGPTQTTNLVPLTGVSATVSGNAQTAAATVSVTTVTGGSVNIGPTGSGTAFTNLQPSLALTFVIAVNGIYPSRP